MYKGSLFLVSALWNYFIIKMSFLLISLFYKKKKSYQNIQVERSGIFVNCLWWSLCSSSLKNVVLILTDRNGGQQPIVLHHPRCVVNEKKEFFWGGKALGKIPVPQGSVMGFSGSVYSSISVQMRRVLCKWITAHGALICTTEWS